MIGKLTGFAGVAAANAAKVLPLAPVLLVAAMALMAVVSALEISGWKARLGAVLHHPDRDGEHDTMQLVNRARGLIPTHHRLPVQGPLPCPDGSSGGHRRSVPDHQERPACG